jgi:hypothetical protein
LPRLDRFFANKSLLHRYDFVNITKGLKVIVITDSHIKFIPNEPQHLQQIIFKNTIVVSRINFRDCKFLSCKIFALQDCAVNHDSFVTSALNHKVIEHLAIINVTIGVN